MQPPLIAKYDSAGQYRWVRGKDKKFVFCCVGVMSIHDTDFAPSHR
jgi:hypothetical protein